MSRYLLLAGSTVLLSILAIAQPADKLSFVPEIPALLRLKGGGGMEIEAILANRISIEGVQIKGVLMSPQTKKPASGEKLVLVAYCVALESTAMMETDTNCKDRSMWDGIANIRREAQTNINGEFAFRDVPVGEYAIFVIRSATALQRRPRTDTRPTGIPITSLEVGQGMTVFTLKNEGESKNITVWIGENNPGF
jgi:hypothetical protein